MSHEHPAARSADRVVPAYHVAPGLGVQVFGTGSGGDTQGQGGEAVCEEGLGSSRTTWARNSSPRAAS